MKHSEDWHKLLFSLWSLPTLSTVIQPDFAFPILSWVLQGERIRGPVSKWSLTFPFPWNPKARGPSQDMKILLLFLSLPASGSTLLFFRKSEVFWRLASQEKEIIKTDIRNPPDVDPGKCPYGEESAGRKDWTASKQATEKEGELQRQKEGLSKVNVGYNNSLPRAGPHN